MFANRLYFSIKKIIFFCSIFFFIIHTLLLVTLKVTSIGIGSLNVNSFIHFFSFIKLDSMGVSWLYISSLVIIFCQLIIIRRSFFYTQPVKDNINYSLQYYGSLPTGSSTWWVFYLFVIQTSLTFLFLTDNVLIFYISFEATLLPFFLWIGEAALRNRRWHAAFFLVFFTLLGSIGMLWSICILYKVNNSFSISDYIYSSSSNNNLHLLWSSFILFTFSFLIKFPVFPFASWLPEAHVEASTEASVLLAAVLLKVAPFGFYKIIIPSFSYWYAEYASILLIIGLFSSLYYVLSLLVQTDLKRATAYTSIIHMSIMLCLLVETSKTSMFSAFLMGALHSFCSAGLFCCIGYLYDKEKNKNLNYLSGLADVRPIFSVYFFLFNLVNIGYPLIGSYISEGLLFIISEKSNNYFYTLLIVFILYFLTCSAFFMLSKILYRSWHKYSIRKTSDLLSEESYSLFLLFIVCVFFGMFPGLYLSYINDSIAFIIYCNCV